MKKSLKATSIVESIVVLLIVVTGIVWVFWLLKSSQELANSTANRIEAIQIARDWLEAFTSIRDTNWILYWADAKNCWNTFNYDSSCIWDHSSSVWYPNSTYINHTWVVGFTLYRNVNNQFEIRKRNSNNENFSDPDYRNRFWIRKDTNGFYTQQGWSLYTANGSEPLYTREIRINYLAADNTLGGSTVTYVKYPKMQVTAIVQWREPNSPEPKRLEMTTMLTNWKDTN